MKTLTKDLTITAFGATTSIATAVLLALVETHLNIAIYSFSFLFVIPVGSFMAGLLAATGYVLGARFFNHRPGALLVLSILAVSTSTFFIVHYLNYNWLQIGIFQVHVRDHIPFKEYLRLVLTHAAIETRHFGSTGELGTLGYVYAGLQILGFSFGGLGAYCWLLTMPYCETCSKYFAHKVTIDRYADDPDKLVAFMETLVSALKADHVAKAIKLYKDFGSSELKGRPVRIQLKLWGCKKCARNAFRFTVSKLNGNTWDEISDLKQEGVTQEKLSV